MSRRGKQRTIWMVLLVLFVGPAILCTYRLMETMITQNAEIPDAPARPLGDMMQKKLGMIGTPPWPQSDNRIARAIAEGAVLLNVSARPMETERVTIVSAFYEFTKSKHSAEEYEVRIKRLLRTNDPLIIFVDPADRWAKFVTTRRTHAPTIVAHLPFQDLVTSTTFTDSFWQEQLDADVGGASAKQRGYDVYKIWNEKPILVHAVLEMNPFQSSVFAWMDAGYFKADHQSKEGEAIINLNITQAGVPPSKILILHIRNDSPDVTPRVETAGNAWIGTAKALYDFYDKYYLVMWDWITTKRFVGIDQEIMTEVCYRYPSVCHPYFPGRFRQWRDMAVVLGKTDHNLSKVSPHYHFGTPPERNPPAYPQGAVTTMYNL